MITGHRIAVQNLSSSRLLSGFAEWGMTLAHGVCAEDTRARVDFKIDGETMSLSHQTMGTLPDSTLAMVAQALHESTDGGISCGYEIMLARLFP